MNTICILGNLCRDWERRDTTNNHSVYSNTIASNVKRGEREETAFFDISAWDKAGEILNQYAGKGDRLYVVGRGITDQWEDKDSGAKRSKLKVVVESFQFIGGKQEGQGGQQDGGRQRPASSSGKRQGEHAPASQGDHVALDDDSIPFSADGVCGPVWRS